MERKGHTRGKLLRLEWVQVWLNRGLFRNLIWNKIDHDRGCYSSKTVAACAGGRFGLTEEGN